MNGMSPDFSKMHNKMFGSSKIKTPKKPKVPSLHLKKAKVHKLTKL